MANAKMEALKKKKLLELEARMSADSKTEENPIKDDDSDVNELEAQETESIEQPDEKQPDKSDAENSEDEQPDEKQPDEKPDKQSNESDENFKRKFERISGKVSSLEKEKNKAIKEAEEARIRAAELEARLQVFSSKSSKDDDDTGDDSDEYDWLSGDDNPSKDQPKAQPKAQRSNDIDVESEVNKVIQKREKEESRKRFFEAANNLIKELDGDYTFVELINEPQFDEYVMGDEINRALWNDLVSRQDESAIGIMKHIVTGYLGQPKEEPKPKQASVSVKSKKEAVKKQENKVTYEQYADAVKQKGKPNVRSDRSKRAKYQKIIETYLAQNN